MIDVRKIHTLLNAVSSEQRDKTCAEDCEFCKMNADLSADPQLQASFRLTADVILIRALTESRLLQHDFMEMFLAGIQIGIRYERMVNFTEYMEKISKEKT